MKRSLVYRREVSLSMSRKRGMSHEKFVSVLGEHFMFWWSVQPSHPYGQEVGAGIGWTGQFGPNIGSSWETF